MSTINKNKRLENKNRQIPYKIEILKTNNVGIEITLY